MLDVLNNKTITRVEVIHDYLQLYFADGSVLNIFNHFDLLGAWPHRSEGTSIVGTAQSAAEFALVLSNGATLRIGLDEEDFVGPEAMEYVDQGGTRVTWP